MVRTRSNPTTSIFCRRNSRRTTWTALTKTLMAPAALALRRPWMRIFPSESETVSKLNRYVLLSTGRDRKSTRLNSSHSQISYAVFCLKKKKKKAQAEHHHHTRSEHPH